MSDAPKPTASPAELGYELANPLGVVIANLEVIAEVVENLRETAPEPAKAWLDARLHEFERPLRDATVAAERLRAIGAKLRRLAAPPGPSESARVGELVLVAQSAAPALAVDPRAHGPAAVVEVKDDDSDVLDDSDLLVSLPPPPVSQLSEDAKVVLVIEDDPAIRTMVSKSLGRAYTVYEACDGQEAAELLEKIPNPDAVVCDIAMPRMDGLALAKRMKADPKLSTIPIVFLTARDRFQDVVDGINVGARHYLKKPVKLKDLMEKVASVVATPYGPRR